MHSVVIVDRHPAVRLDVSLALTTTGRYQVTGEADDTLSVMTMIQDLCPDLVILDLDLPGLSGLRLTKQVRVSQEAKVIAISEDEKPLFTARAAKAGANACMRKCGDFKGIVNASDLVLAGYDVFARSLRANQGGSHPGMPHEFLIDTLSGRELTVLHQLARGSNDVHIAQLLSISHKTVSTYKARILRKLNISGLIELVDFARAHDVVREGAVDNAF